MKKIGIIFPGQGSQKVGMGKRLYETFDYVKSLYKKADEVLGFNITELCFNGPEDELRKTYNTQPALLLTSYAIWSVLKEKIDIKPTFVAGHSLGEWSALLVSGFFTFEDALMLTRKRGLFMEEACPKGKGGMVALIGPIMEKVLPVLKEISHDDYICVPANLNAHDQVVLSGDINALKEAVEKLKGVGYKKAVFLNVSGPFHSPLMKAAADRLNDELNKVPVGELNIPVVSNVDAEPTYEKEKVKDKLYRQMFSPVLWEDSVKRMVKEGVEIFLEVGPQKVLTNLIKKIAPDVLCISVEELEDIESIRGNIP
ncbi:MAG TPA: ACP S-malonyltransferase [Syntrophorhabdaceae bacterium]|nr:ACP S-malonyltransferase [Syntrophorhabdaceae bacterium]